MKWYRNDDVWKRNVRPPYGFGEECAERGAEGCDGMIFEEHYGTFQYRNAVIGCGKNAVQRRCIERTLETSSS